MARPDPFADLPQALRWREGPDGQHVELGIAEHDLFLMLAALGLTAELSGATLLPIGTLYDPFVTRGLDALYHALYAGARFVVAATPSGISLAPEGGAHQSVITPGIGVALPDLAYYEPTFAREVEWILLAGLRAVADATGEPLPAAQHGARRPAPGPAAERRVPGRRAGRRLPPHRRAHRPRLERRQRGPPVRDRRNGTGRGRGRGPARRAGRGRQRLRGD